MGHKKNILFGLVFLLAIFAIGAVSATTTLDAPAASATVSGATVNFSVTSDLAGDWNCTAYGQSTLTANSSWATLGGGPTVANETATIWNITFDSSIIEDANNYIFNATCINGTDTEGDTNIGITVDNTAPTAPTLAPASLTEITSSTTQTFTGTVVDATTTSCTYAIARGGASSGSDYISGSGTYSGTSCTFTKTFDGTDDNGVWYWSTTASDETNTTSSGQNKVVVSLPGSGGGLPCTGDDCDEFIGDGDDGSNAFWWILGIIVAIVIVVALVMSARK